MHHGLQRAIQITYAIVTGAQIYLQHQKTQARAAAERDERVRRALNAQIRADRDAARAQWAPALDPGWLHQADLLQTARTWAAAMPYADRAVPWYEPTAATAMRKCEERLRGLHPHAMARYDRLRADGMGPAEAMRETAPLFTRPPNVRDAPFTPRPALDEQTPVVASVEHGPRRGGFDAHVAATPAAAERTQNLAGARDAAASADAATAHAARAVRPWERDFPMPIQDVVARTASTSGVPASAHRPPQWPPALHAAADPGTDGFHLGGAG